MPQQTDHPDQPKTLPLPELNPLLNPLLGENMGRWAEVYFRNPPENRERAVLELVQQLEAENAAREKTDITQTPALEPAPARQSRTSFLETARQSLRCDSCGHDNAGDQRFCGMCGVPLRNDAAAVRSLGVHDAPRDEQSSRPEETAVEPRLHEEQFLYSPDQPQNLDPSQPHDNVTVQFPGYEERPRSYRIYIGAALAVVILALGYVAWRSGQARPGSPLAVQAPPSITATEPPIPAPAKVKIPSPTPPATAAATPREEAGAPTDDSKTDDNRMMSPAAMVAKEPAAPKPQLPADAANGLENGSGELAMAQTYLNGTAGHERDNAQAADWLWKAVAKRNAAATLLLSDLYLRGSGVARNCDQARVLLDAAASRGIKDAAARLRNMQAFGCE